MINIMIVEEDPATLGYLHSLLAGAPGLSVSGVFADAEAAISALESRLTPDVVLTGLEPSGKTGIDLIREVRKRGVLPEILVLTVHAKREYLVESFRAGASGYILKGTSAIDIIRAIEDVMDGGAPISPRVARFLVDEFTETKPPAAKPVISTREREVLLGVAGGMSEKILAAALKLSPHTIHAHIKNIFKKLQVNSKVAALTKARNKGII